MGRPRRGWLIPREHGAWGMLFQPFIAAAILVPVWTPALPVSLMAALCVFLMREPLLILARQRWRWRDRRPESADARWWLLWELAVAGACGAYLWMKLPRLPLAIFGAIAAGMTLVSVAMALRNRQRSPVLQVAVAASLGATCLLAALSATLRAPLWAWQLWALLTMHSVAAIFVVHARLVKSGGRAFTTALWVDAAQLAAGIMAGLPLAAPLYFSAAANALELRRARTPEPLTRVGLRTLAISLAHTALCVAVLSRRV